VAAKSGSVELIKYLVDCGADINAIELRGGNALLHWAVAGQQIDLIQFLIERCDATLNVLNYAQQTPMRVAWDALRARPGSKRIIIMLHLLREKGGEPRLLPVNMSDSEMSDMSDSSDSE
jgi:ankyrin repeat protein